MQPILGEAVSQQNYWNSDPYDLSIPSFVMLPEPQMQDMWFTCIHRGEAQDSSLIASFSETVSICHRDSSFGEGWQVSLVCLYKIKTVAEELHWSMGVVEADRLFSKTPNLTSPGSSLISSTRHNFSPCWMAQTHLVMGELPPKCECTYCSIVDILVIVWFIAIGLLIAFLFLQLL